MQEANVRAKQERTATKQGPRPSGDGHDVEPGTSDEEVIDWDAEDDLSDSDEDITAPPGSRVGAAATPTCAATENQPFAEKLVRCTAGSKEANSGRRQEAAERNKCAREGQEQPEEAQLWGALVWQDQTA